MIFPKPSVTRPELAEAALACTPLARARLLAEWIGTGREVTSSGVLRPAVAVQACGALGINLPSGKLRSAKDVPELMRDWDVAAVAAFIEQRGNRVRAADDLAELGPPDAERVLRSWLWIASAALGLPYGACPQCLTVLFELSLASAVSVADLAEAVHDADPPEEAAAHVASSVDWLTEFGAASTGPGVTAGGAVRLTPLGRMFADSVLAGYTPELDADADTLIGLIIALPPKIARAVSAGWLTARPPAQAVSELLRYAESADPDQRIMALGIARELGPEAAQAWLAGAMMPQGLESLAFFAAVQQASPDEVSQTLAKLAGSGHRDAELITRLISSYLPGQGGFTRQDGVPLPEYPGNEDDEDDEGEEDDDAFHDAAYQLKITLRGVSKPPVWRRVLVPAGLSLDSLHEVIQLAMGWEGGHMHVFSDGWQHYGVEDAELDHADETGFAVAEMMEEPGDRISYTYDFGDDWEHDIRLEKVLPAESLAGVPVCLAGNGACPPEDCGGAWGYTDLKATLADPGADEHEERLEWLGLATASDFDPAAFSTYEVNARLARLRISADSPN